MNISKANIKDSVGRDTVSSVSKLLLTAVWVVFMLYLLTLLPGIDRIVPQTSVTFVAVVGAIATLVMVGVLLYMAPKLALLVRMSLDGSKTIIENIASVVYWLVVLVAVLVANRGLAGVVTPLLDGSMWIYDVVFLLVALPVVVIIGTRLYASLDPGSDLLADKLVGQKSDSTTDHDDMASNTNE